MTMELAKKRIFVTGRAGFIVSNLANTLAASNDITVVDDEYLGTNIDPEYVENPVPEDVYVRDICADIEKMTEETGGKTAISLEEWAERVCEAYEIKSQRINLN